MIPGHDFKNENDHKMEMTSTTKQQKNEEDPKYEDFLKNEEDQENENNLKQEDKLN